MHIGFQRSGGRGEYEVVGSHSGFNAIGLEGWTFQLRWPDGVVRDTQLVLEPAGSGKPRLRSQATSRFQIGRMVAAMCMLPDPRREFSGVGRDLPQAVRQGYVLTRLGFGQDTEFSPVIDMVTIDPTFIELEDDADVLSIGIESRWSRIQRVYERAVELPFALRTAIEQHRAYMATGDAVGVALVTIVRSIDSALINAYQPHISGNDPLSSLEGLLGLTLPDVPTLPPPDKLGEDEPEVSARSAVEYRLAKMRGPEARRFSLGVREAYDHTCAFCGHRFGGITGVPSGVDAAHILAWSRHDLDVVSNGISLCKLHHWAFDAALALPIAHSSGAYTLHLTHLAVQLSPEARARLVPTSGMSIPEAWLPSDLTLRPKKRYLDQLHADLAVTFAA